MDVNAKHRLQRILMLIVTNLIQTTIVSSAHLGIISIKKSAPRLMILAKALMYKLEFVLNVIQDIHSASHINVLRRKPKPTRIHIVLNGKILCVQNVLREQSLIGSGFVPYWIQIAGFTKNRVKFVLHAMMDTLYKIESVSKPHPNLWVIQTVIHSIQTVNAQNVQMDITSAIWKYALKLKTVASSLIQSHKNVLNVTQVTNLTQLINALKAFRK